MIRRNKIRDSKFRYALNWVVTVFFIIYCTSIIYPFVWMFLNSLMPTARAYAEGYTKFLAFPTNPTLQNYADVLAFKVSTGGTTEWTMWGMSFNTIWLGLLLPAISLVLPTCCAYCCAKYKFIGANFFFYYGIVFCAIPLFGGTATTYKILFGLNLYDTLASRFFLTIMGSTWGGFLFLFAFFKGISWSLAESGFMDGANDFQVFFYLMLPHVVPILLTFFIGNFIAFWNDWMTSYLFTPSIPMIGFGVQKIVKLAQYGDKKLTWPMAYAALALNMLVPLGLFLIFSKRILNTVYTGGLKG